MKNATIAPVTKSSKLSASIEHRAVGALGYLLARGIKGDAKPDVTSWHQARKYACAAMSWCQSRIELPNDKKSGRPRLHSRRRNGATYRLWARVIELCDAHLASE